MVQILLHLFKEYQIQMTSLLVMEAKVKNKSFKLFVAATISFSYGGAFAAADFVRLVQLPGAAHTFASTAPRAATKSPLNVAYRPQSLTFTNFPPESANSMMFNGVRQAEFSLTIPHSELYADKSQKSKHPAQTVQQPERYTMILAGLGMMAAIVRRRHKASTM